MNKNYKAFLFAHTALKPICAGVQNAHVISEMFVNESKDTASRKILHEWAKSHKTIIMRDGGISANLENIAYIVETVAPIIHIPHARFYESEEYMEGIMTSVGFVLDRNHPTTQRFKDYKIKDLVLLLQDDSLHLKEQEAYDILVSVINNTRSFS